MTQSAVATKSSISPLSETQWRVIWLRKLGKSLDENMITGVQAEQYRATVEKFLFDNPGPPVAVRESAITSFLSKAPPDVSVQVIDSLLIFYKNTVGSEKHAAFTASLREQSEKPKSNPLLDRLSQELRLRNYSPRTAKNYGAIVSNYLTWLKRDPSADDLTDIKRYQLYLKEKQNFSPRTVNLATAALLFFYNNILKTRFSAASLPRMKTGRQLPKVYSEQEISKIIAVVSNPKHRLILMLAYGCGLRLSEIQHLRETILNWTGKL